MKKAMNETFKLKPALELNYSFAAFYAGARCAYSTLFWSVFGPADRYNWQNPYRYEYAYGYSY